MKHLALIYSLLFISQACATASLPEVQGHRGARARRPENTLAAFDYALRAGTPVLEMDLGVTKDNVVVVHHDLKINTKLCKTSEPSLARADAPYINELTLAEIKTFDCGSLRNPKFPDQILVPGEKIPTLIEVLRFLKNSDLALAKTARLNIETKIEESEPNATVSPQLFVELIKDVLQAEDFPIERIILQSFDFRTIIYAKEKWPSLKTAALVYDVKSHETKDMNAYVASIFERTQANYLSPDGNSCSRQMVEATHRHGKKIIVWTINKKKEWRHFAELKVDGIISDDPEAVIKYFSGQNIVETP